MNGSESNLGLPLRRCWAKSVRLGEKIPALNFRLIYLPRLGTQVFWKSVPKWLFLPIFVEAVETCWIPNFRVFGCVKSDEVHIQHISVSGEILSGNHFHRWCEQNRLFMPCFVEVHPNLRSFSFCPWCSLGLTCFRDTFEIHLFPISIHNTKYVPFTLSHYKIGHFTYSC